MRAGTLASPPLAIRRPPRRQPHRHRRAMKKVIKALSRSGNGGNGSSASSFDRCGDSVGQVQSGGTPSPTSTGREGRRHVVSARAAEERSQGADEDYGFELSAINHPGADRPRREKRIILIRHARSTWNEFLGQHKKAEWEEQERQRRSLRSSLASMVRRGGGEEQAEEGEGGDEQARHGFWQGVRGGVKHAVNALSHAGKLHQVDHKLSGSGIAEARALRASIAAVCRGDGAEPAASSLPSTAVASLSTSLALFDAREEEDDADEADDDADVVADDTDGTSASGVAPDDLHEGLLLNCKQWYVSPYLRALQTAAYAISPLRRRDPHLRMIVTPLAKEIIKSGLSQDCQGKKGNVGFRITARALSKTVEALEENCEEYGSAREQQEELADIASTLCAMDLSEVGSAWWTDLGGSKDDLRQEDRRQVAKSLWLSVQDDRIRRLVGLLLRQEDDVVGVVAHSLLFQRMLQLFWPEDAAKRERLRGGLVNGSVAESVDPLRSKIMNCGTLVLRWSYCEDSEDPEGDEDLGVDRMKPQIVGARFLFGGQFEGALQGDGTDAGDADGDIGDVSGEVPIDGDVDGDALRPDGGALEEMPSLEAFIGQQVFVECMGPHRCSEGKGEAMDSVDF